MSGQEAIVNEEHSAASLEAGASAGTRRVSPEGVPNVSRVGVPRDWGRDLYYTILESSWPGFYALLIGFYLGLTAIFAVLYAFDPHAIGSDRTSTWLDPFFFSIETLATVGYGVLHPETLYAHLVATTEIVFGVMTVPTATGLTILKFARPTARVLFSRNVLITEYDGHRSLIFRAANVRSSVILEAHLKLVLLQQTTTTEGQTIRRLIDLPLVRDNNPLFALSWTITHRITADSPFADFDAAACRAGRITLIALLTGLDASTSATVHTRHAYEAVDFVFDHHFVDIIGDRPGGGIQIDYAVFHDIRPV